MFQYVSVWAQGPGSCKEAGRACSPRPCRTSGGAGPAPVQPASQAGSCCTPCVPGLLQAGARGAHFIKNGSISPRRTRSMCSRKCQCLGEPREKLLCVTGDTESGARFRELQAGLSPAGISKSRRMQDNSGSCGLSPSQSLPTESEGCPPQHHHGSPKFPRREPEP